MYSLLSLEVKWQKSKTETESADYFSVMGSWNNHVNDQVSSLREKSWHVKIINSCYMYAPQVVWHSFPTVKTKQGEAAFSFNVLSTCGTSFLTTLRSA